jgi:hypothetical protein
MTLLRSSAVTVLLAAGSSQAGVFSYECTAFPEQAGFDIVQIVCEPELWLAPDGLFQQHVELCPGYPPPGGQEATYRRSLADFHGVPTFVID